MNKERLVPLFVLMFAALWGAAVAQTPPKVYRLGLLGCGPPPADSSDIVAGLIRGLAQRSYRQILVTAEPVRRRRLWADGQPVWR